MGKHRLMQTYSQNYLKLCMTGLYGCRWQRYKQSALYFRKTDMFWSTFLVLTTCFTIFWCYFWLVAKNDQDDFNWYMYTLTQSWYSWYHVCLALASTIFAYCVVLLILALCHMIVGYQVFIHMFHRLVLVAILSGTIAMLIVLNNLWSEEFAVQRIALHMFGPFIQVALVILMTTVSWVVIEHWCKLPKLYAKAICAVIYLGIMIPIYIMPFLVQSPCVTDNNIPERPKIFAHKGAAAVAPENTLASFKDSLNYADGIETDIRISFDGVPFLLHDSTLGRTTNVAEVYPERVHERAEMFNMSDLQKLNAGSWFVGRDPFGTATQLSETQKRFYNNQTIPRLDELLNVLENTKLNLIMDIFGPPKENPYKTSYQNVTIELFKNSSIPRERFYLQDRVDNFSDEGFTLTVRGKVPINTLKELRIHSVNAWYSEVSDTDISEYLKNNISVNMYTVNSHWLYSYYWCMGVTSVTSDTCHLLSLETAPLWTMTPLVYTAVWITIDIISAIIVILIFVFQRVHLDKTQTQTEILAINTSGPSRLMTERDPRLLDAGKDVGLEEVEIEDGTVNMGQDDYNAFSRNNNSNNDWNL